MKNIIIGIIVGVLIAVIGSGAISTKTVEHTTSSGQFQAWNPNTHTWDDVGSIHYWDND